MLCGAALRKTGKSYEFASEATLENFVWGNLQHLFGLTPLARQYQALGEFCDIIAVNNSKQLSIIELKNTEDRYIIQQLTRYYDNLASEKPFADKIDYDLPVQLIAIAPSFHRHNHIDRKYSKLKIDFLQLAITRKSQDFYLQLTNCDTNFVNEVQIPYQELDIAIKASNVLAPPQLLLDWLGSCNGDQQQAIIKMRERILSFDERIKEKIEGKNTIKYKGKSQLVAELYFQKKTLELVIFLWLPIPSSLFGDKKEVIGRVRLWIDGTSVSHVGHIPEGVGKMKLQSQWDAIPKEKQPQLMQSLSYKSLIPVSINWYGNLRDSCKISDSLELLVDLSLSKWLVKV
jgi:RecB family endonuclease NucS